MFFQGLQGVNRFRLKHLKISSAGNSNLAHLLKDGTKMKNIQKSSHFYLIHINTRKFISGRKQVEYHATSTIAKERRPEQATIERQIFSAWVQPPWQRQILHQPVHPT